ncbi:MAG: hypothetical protein NTU83_06400, partial [Candidatus Hydrogenedentes bacterium]|nr:hypothetical protein [Candidatus Hydrogenedentota bacterium]
YYSAQTQSRQALEKITGGYFEDSGLKGKTAEAETEHWQQRMMDTRRWLEHRRMEKPRKRAASG